MELTRWVLGRIKMIKVIKFMRKIKHWEYGLREDEMKRYFKEILELNIKNLTNEYVCATITDLEHWRSMSPTTGHHINFSHVVYTNQHVTNQLSVISWTDYVLVYFIP